MGRFFAVSTPALTFNFQNPSLIPAYLVTLFIGMLESTWKLILIISSIMDI
jgi:hypothetical protein